jgi:hypothetical protein
MLSRFLLAAVLVVGLSAWLPAKDKQKSQQPPAMQPTEIEGTVESTARGGLVVVDKNNQSWQVFVPMFAKVHVTGTATADFLQTGQIVEFKAELDERGAIVNSVDELTIITLSEEKQPGLFPAETAKVGEDVGGFGATPGADISGAGGKPAKRTGTAAGKGAKAGAMQPGTYRVVGRLVIHGDKLSVRAGNRGTVPFELGETPTIAVDFADYSVAAKGDKVSIKAIKGPSRSGVTLAQATEVKIELAESLVGVKKKGTAAKSESKRPAKRPKKDDGGLPEPAADK